MNTVNTTATTKRYSESELRYIKLDFKLTARKLFKNFQKVLIPILVLLTLVGIFIGVGFVGGGLLLAANIYLWNRNADTMAEMIAEMEDIKASRLPNS